MCGPLRKRTERSTSWCCQADDRQFGLVVDQINDTEEIVVKPLRKQLKTVKTLPDRASWGTAKWRSSWTCSAWRNGASVVSETRTAAPDCKSHGFGGEDDKQTFLLFAGPAIRAWRFR